MIMHITKINTSAKRWKKGGEYVGNQTSQVQTVKKEVAGAENSLQSAYRPRESAPTRIEQ